MIAARVEVRGERAPRERQAQQRERPWAGVLTSRLPPERSTRRTSESHAAVSATCSITSPAHTTSKLASSSSHGAPSSTSRRSSSRLARPRAAQRLLGDVDPDDARTRAHQLGREAPLAAADVEHALAAAHALEQEAPAQREVGRLQALGSSLPEGFVVARARASDPAARLSHLSNRRQSDYVGAMRTWGIA